MSLRGKRVDELIAKLAERQHGVVDGRKLMDLGVSRGAIRHRLCASRPYEIHAGVYTVGHGRVTAQGRLLAAALARGAGAVVSHRSAAALWGMRPTARSPIDVTTPRRGLRERPGIDLHRVRCLCVDDRDSRDGIPVTSVARTLLDLAELLSRRQLERVFEEAERLELLDMRQVAATCERAHGHHGLGALRKLIDYRIEDSSTRSELERRFVDLCRTSGLEPPTTNLQVAGWEVDAVWRHHRLVVELDGFSFHRTRAAFERDRRRDAELQLAGYRVLRITARRLDREPGAVLQAIRKLLAR